MNERLLRSLGIFAIGGIAGLAALPADAAVPHKSVQYTYQIISISGQASSVVPYGIDSAGDIVGDYLDYASVNHPFLYSKGTVTPLVPTGTEFFTSTANFISEAGAIVGFGTTSAGVAGFEFNKGKYTVIQAPGSGAPMTYLGAAAPGAVAGYDANTQNFFVDKKGKFTYIFNNPVNQGDAVIGMNARGTVVGTYNAVAGDAGSASAFIALDGAPGVTLAVPSPGGGVLLAGLNSADEVVGTVNAANGFSTQGFLYKSGQVSFVNYPAAILTGVTGINDAGTIVGYGVDQSGNYDSFTLSPSGVFSTLAVPAAFALATGINKSGVVIGTCFDSATFAPSMFIATPVK